MNLLKKFKVLFIVAALACSAMILGACDSGKNSKIDADGNVTYKVTVKDALGNAYTSGVVAKFLQNGTQVAMQVGDDKGIVTKKLKAGNYDVEISFTDGDEGYHYNKDNVKVSVEKNEIDVVVAHAATEEGRELIISDNPYPSYVIKPGCTYVKLDTEHRNYFLFTPTEAGKYEISIVEGSNVEIGYYGAPHYVQQHSALEVKDNKFAISIKQDMIGTGDTGTTIIVVGVDAKDASAKNCVIGIERVGDPDYDITDEPWTIYKKTTTLSKFTLQAGAKLAEFDITSTAGYNLVYNETDGFYHMNSADGPLVLVRLSEDPKYVACFKTILDNTGVNKYFFDADGNFVKKESYSECLLEYIEMVDENLGVYPLTKDLEYIIKNGGGYKGWFDQTSDMYLFKDIDGIPMTNINNDISWLFMCCYVSE